VRRDRTERNPKLYLHNKRGAQAAASAGSGNGNTFFLRFFIAPVIPLAPSKSKSPLRRDASHLDSVRGWAP
jgi:hypothetical protein